MDTQYNNTSLRYICEGCLSSDRKLNTIYDVDYKRIFLDLLDSLEQVNQDLLLCWECTAIVRSVIRFQKQIKTAHDCLIRYMISQATHVKSLSRIEKCTNITEDFHLNVEKDDKSWINESIIKYDLINSSSQIEIDVDTNIQEPYANVKDFVKDSETRPVFVKIEDNDFDHADSFYENENNEYLGDKDEVIETKTDNLDTIVKSKRIKSKKKKKKKDEYDESDDEPLKPSKKERKGRAKKKETDDKAVAKPGGKREKPAGVVTNPRVSRNLEKLNVLDGQIEMVVLSWEEVEAERQKALASVVFTRHEYRCYHCVLGFNHRVKLDNHMKKHDPGAGAAECSVCRVRCRDDRALVAHKRRHRVRWRCVQCGDASSRAAVAADHAARAHGAAPVHTCRTCGLTLQSLGKLRNHMKNHGERQKCDLCGKTFRDKTSLRTHLFIHRGEKEYSCEQCGKRFLFKKALEVHLVTHSAPAPLYCLECDMTFKNQMSYYHHKKYNLKHIDPAKLKYQCPLCDKRFLKAFRLEEHNFAVHLKVTPMRCTVPGCDISCSSRAALRTHTRMVHRNARATRNHVCDTCGKAYTTKKILEGHMRSHTGERPFRCPLCPSTFSYSAALYNHNKLVHRGGKSGRRAPAAAWAPTDTSASTNPPTAVQSRLTP